MDSHPVDARGIRLRRVWQQGILPSVPDFPSLCGQLGMCRGSSALATSQPLLPEREMVADKRLRARLSAAIPPKEEIKEEIDDSDTGTTQLERRVVAGFVSLNHVVQRGPSRHGRRLRHPR